MKSIFDWVSEYEAVGFYPIPLIPNDKRPAGKYMSHEEIIFHENNNIGLVAGTSNGFIVVDLDDSQAVDSVSKKLEALGLWDSLTIVRTPSRKGLHIYFKCFDIPDHLKKYHKLNSILGKGEVRLRFPTYVVAPGSSLKAGSYEFIQGGIQEFVNSPVVLWNEISWLIDGNHNIERKVHPVVKYSEQNVTPMLPPVRLLYRENPQSAFALSKLLKNAKRGDFIPWENHVIKHHGKELHGYNSTSEAEAALVMMLIQSGWNFQQIKDHFDLIASPHYIEAGDGYLLYVYNNAMVKMKNGNYSKQIEEVYKMASYIPWSGRHGGYDKKVLLAIYSKAWQYNTMTPKVSRREISEHAGIRINSVKEAVKRLQESGFLHILLSESAHAITTYDISMFESVMNRYITKELKHVSNVTLHDTSPTTSELWSRGFLGESAGLIYPYLSPKVAISENALMKATGKTRNTVKKGLGKLSHWGLAEYDGNRLWLRGYSSLETVAAKIGAIEKAENRRANHRKDRDYYMTKRKEYGQQKERKNNNGVCLDNLPTEIQATMVASRLISTENY